MRPVLSLDACHLKSRYKGTLYIATALSANNKLYPVAFAICRENENTAGWTYFLSELKRNLPLLDSKNPNPRCELWANFAFISDRDKGLINAMKIIFPDNLHTNCLFHISKNVQKMSKSKIPWRLVFNIGKSFDIRTEMAGLESMLKISPEAVNYCLSIDPKLWRCTEWTKNMELPPRYNMYTSNISESTNSMFDSTREHSWLYTIDCILNLMIRRHDEKFKLYKNFSDKNEVVPCIKWVRGAGY